MMKPLFAPVASTIPSDWKLDDYYESFVATILTAEYFYDDDKLMMLMKMSVNVIVVLLHRCHF